MIEDEAGDFSIADEDRAALTDPEFASMVLGWWLLPSRYIAFARLGEAVRTGRQPYELAFGHDFHEHLRAFPEEARLYEAAVNSTVESFREAIAAYDFAGVNLAADLGGGGGVLMSCLLSAHPGIRGILFDLPEVIGAIGPSGIPADVSDRITLIAGDLLVGPIPKADLYLMSTVARVFDDDRFRRVLDNVRVAMNPDSRLAILDFVQPPGPARPGLGMADIDALVAYGGVDRTADGFREVLARSTLSLSRVIPINESYSWVEALPA